MGVEMSPRKEFKSPLGSLKSLRVSPPVLAMVTVTLMFSNPSELTFNVEGSPAKLGAVNKPGAAETAAT